MVGLADNMLTFNEIVIFLVLFSEPRVWHFA